jgi:translation machinery-associated protein 16
MPTTLEKTRKQIAKKRGGDVVLHKKSRNSLRLHKAHVRDLKLGKLAAARNKKEQVIGKLCHHDYHMSSGVLTRFLTADRVAYFQVNVKENGAKPLEMAAAQELIQGYSAPRKDAWTID